MKFLVDTSVWSLALRKKGPSGHPVVKKLEILLLHDEDIVIHATILQEILQAFRDESIVKKVAARFEAVPLLDWSREDAIKAASIYRRCRSKGVSVSTPDCQIAQAAISHGCLLLSADNDFGQIAKYSALKLA